MRGDLDIEGNLYEALDHFLGQMGKFSTNESALKKDHVQFNIKEEPGKGSDQPL